MVRRVAIEAADPAPEPFRRRFAPPRPGRILDTALGPAFLFVYMLAAFLPGHFALGPIRLTPFRVLLLIAFVPLFLRWIQGQAGRITLPDILFLGFCGWIAIAMLAVHGTSQIIFVGSNFVEGFGAYLAGRVIIRSADDYKLLFRNFLIILLMLLPFAVFEALTRVRLLSNLVGMVLSTAGQYPYENVQRMGLTRVIVGFNHPILWGIVTGLGFANVWYIYRDRLVPAVRNTALVLFMAFLSLSSGPFFGLVLQGVLMAWERIMAGIRSRWVLAAAVGAAGLAILHVVLPGGLVGYIVNELIFSPYAGQARVDIFIWGFREVAANPIFGIGLTDWVRPHWQSASVDNFWLLIAMRHGLPGFFLFVAAVGLSAYNIMTCKTLDERESRYRSGYLIALAGMVLALGTSYVWGGAFVFVMTYLGAGSWLYARDFEEGPRRMPRERRRPDAPETARPAPPVRPSAGPVRTAGPARPGPTTGPARMGPTMGPTRTGPARTGRGGIAGGKGTGAARLPAPRAAGLHLGPRPGPATGRPPRGGGREKDG